MIVAIRDRVKAVKALFRRCLANPRLTKYDDYLSAIYDAYVEVLSLGKGPRQNARALLVELGPKSRKHQHLVRLLIDATCDPRIAPKMRSRWALAVRYARKKRSQWSGKRAGDFIRGLHGPSVCESKFAKLKKAENERDTDNGW
jgi:hypothetical protein